MKLYEIHLVDPSYKLRRSILTSISKEDVCSIQKREIYLYIHTHTYVYFIYIYINIAIQLR